MMLARLVPQRPAARRVAAAIVLASWPIASRGEETPFVLDKAKVVDLVREQSPAVRVSRARTAEARAARIGAGALAPINPELSASAGPRFLHEGSISLDFNVALSWPFDLSGAPRARAEVADQRVQVADAEAAEAERLALSEALEVWTQARTAEARLAIEQQRATLDAELLRIAQVRRDAGTVGDGDVALATLFQAEGQARLRTAEAEQSATQALLRGRLGLAADAPLSLPPVGEIDTALPDLKELLARLEQHPEIVRSMVSAQVATKDADLQRRIGRPVPRLILLGERSPEYAGHAGVDVALPVYQRNQTNAAVASAHTRTAALEAAATRAKVEAEMRSAYARFAGARAAYEELQKASPAIEDTEHLATRGYELGQGTLSAVVTARREVAGARSALLDAKQALLRARVVIEFASGVGP